MEKERPGHRLIALARAVLDAGPPPEGESEEDREARESERAQAVDRLVEDRLKHFHDDADHRDAVLRVEDCENTDGRHDAFAEASYQYNQQSSGKDREGNPVWNQIRKATANFAAYAMSGVPSCSLTALPREMDGAYTPDLAAFYAREAEETTERIERLVRADLERAQWTDVRDRAIVDASIYGVGYVTFPDDETLDLSDPRVARVLSRPFAAARNARARAVLERLKGETRIKTEHPENVYWQAGVADAFGHDADATMRRVSTLHHPLTDTLRDAYPEHGEIRPFKGPRGVRRASGRDHDRNELQYKRGGGQTTGVLTTWERVEWERRVVETATEVGPDGLPVTRRFTRRERVVTMVKTVIAGDTLLSVDVWDADERPVHLPIIPVYLLENRNHPYGFALPLLLRLSQTFINRIRLILFQHAAAALSAQGIVVDGTKLGPNDDVDAITTGLRNADVVVVEGNVDEDSPMGEAHALKDAFFAPGAQINAPLSVALVQALQMEIDNFLAMSEMADAQRLGAARSAIGKEKELQIADRPKTILLSLLSKSVEAVYLACVANWGRVTDFHAVPVEGGYVLVNEPVRERVRRFEPDGRTPVRNPLYSPMIAQYPDLAAAYPEAAEEFLTYEAEGLFGDTRAYVTARSDSRSWLPSDPMMKLQMLAQFAEVEGGLGFLHMETVKEEAVPDSLLAKDKKVRERIAREEAEALRAAGAAQGNPALQLAGAGAALAPEVMGLPASGVAEQLAALGADPRAPLSMN